MKRVLAWLRGNTFVVGLALVAAIAVAGGIWWVLRTRSAQEITAQGHSAYVRAQQSLHVTEALVQLAVLEGALSGGRPAMDLAARADRLQEDLEWAIGPAAGNGEAWTDIADALDRLVEQILAEDPDATETTERIRALLVDAGGGP